jgi:plastocyanin
MKKNLLILAFAFISGIVFSNKVTISNSGFTFSPADVTINLGDTVVFALAGSHDAVEVSESTWTVNGNAPLPGFSVPFGGGTVTGLTAGVHFYVCEPHASSGMKGKITVTGPSGIDPAGSFDNYFILYPNPVIEKFSLKSRSSFTGNENPTIVEIYNILGMKVYEIQGVNIKDTPEIDLAAFPSGQYIVRISNDKDVYSGRFIKE